MPFLCILVFNQCDRDLAYTVERLSFELKHDQLKLSVLLLSQAFLLLAAIVWGIVLVGLIRSEISRRKLEQANFQWTDGVD